MCNDRELLIGYIYGECDADERTRVDAHVEACHECRQEIRELRRTREDLLAWAVPDHGSVWTPFAPPAVVPWHRQVPRWAMAAAASVMLLAGAAGGAATQMIAARAEGTRAAISAAAPVGRPVEASVPDEELTRRMQALFDGQLDGRLRAWQTANGPAAPSRATAPVVGLEDLRGVQASQAAFEDTVIKWIDSLNRENATLRQTLFDLGQRWDSRNRPVLTNTGGGPGGQ